MLADTGASKVDLVGHSQGGMMPRYYINFLGGASKVSTFVALAPSNYGTTLDGLTTLAGYLGATSLINSGLNARLSGVRGTGAGLGLPGELERDPDRAGVSYTVIESVDDEVVTPYTNAFLPAASNVTNITVNAQCPVDFSDHLEIAADPVAMADMLNALDPASPVRVPCLPVFALTGPVSPGALVLERAATVRAPPIRPRLSFLLLSAAGGAARG